MFSKLKKMLCGDSNAQATQEMTERMILNEGHIWQHKLWRRWVMGQMFHMMTWGQKPLSEANYDRRLKRRGYPYAIRTLKNEIKMQRLLEKNNDFEELNERKRWFTEELLVGLLLDSEKYINLKDASCGERWYNAYKGAGAYFTMKNLILFHECSIHEGDKVLGKEESLKYLKQFTFNDRTTGHDMFVMMMKLIHDNKYVYKCAKREGQQ